MKAFAPPLTRRRFMQGAAAIGALSALPWSVRTVLAAPTRTPVLSGTEFQLEIAPVPMNITGRPMTATGINGQIPAPILRWREGDTVTLAVTNRLDEPSSIPLAWRAHASTHGRRAGPQLPRHPARRNLRLPLPGPSERHLLVPQPFGVSGTDGCLWA